MSFNAIWHSDDEHQWNELLKRYWSLVLVNNVQVEYSLNRLSRERLDRMNAVSWYKFLHNEYFLWKYTAKNRLATTQSHLRKYRDGDALDELDQIRQRIMRIDIEDIESALKTVCQIKGLGVAGASGLLSLIYPAHFATVDQFVVKALLEVDQHKHSVRHMKPEGLSVADGVVLTEIMREKARSMNVQFGSEFWTPRTVEMALWAYRG